MKNKPNGYHDFNQRSLSQRTTVKALGSLEIRGFTSSGFEQQVE